MSKIELMKVVQRVPLLRRVIFFTFCISVALATLWTLAVGVWYFQALRSSVVECIGLQAEQMLPQIAQALSEQNAEATSAILR